MTLPIYSAWSDIEIAFAQSRIQTAQQSSMRTFAKYMRCRTGLVIVGLLPPYAGDPGLDGCKRLMGDHSTRSIQLCANRETRWTMRNLGSAMVWEISSRGQILYSRLIAAGPVARATNGERERGPQAGFLSLAAREPAFLISAQIKDSLSTGVRMCQDVQTSDYGYLGQISHVGGRQGCLLNLNQLRFDRPKVVERPGDFGIHEHGRKHPL